MLFTPGHGEPGGAAARSRLITSQLASQGWGVRVVTRAGTLRRPVLSRSGGVTLIEVPGFGMRRLGGVIYLLVALFLGLLWGRSARALIAIQLMSTTSVAGVCGLLLRRPFVAMSTTSGGLGEARYIAGTRTAGLRCRLLVRAAWIVAQTDGAASELRELVPGGRVTVVPNPVRIPPRPELNGKPYALFAGRFSREKDLLNLLDAWAGVLEECPDARLTLLGAGGDYRSVEVEVRDRVSALDALRESVSFPGWVDQPAAVVGSSDIFVLPSLEEGMSNALLEACALGRVVVASDIPPNRAVLGPAHPLMFPPGDVEQMKGCLLHVLRMDLRERTEVGDALRSRAEMFSPDVVVKKLLGLIDAADSSRH